MGDWILPTLFQVVSQGEELPMGRATHLSPAQQRARAERQWAGAIAAVEAMLQQMAAVPEARGVVFSGPVPVLSQAHLLDAFHVLSFTADPHIISLNLPLQLPPALDALLTNPHTNRILPLFSQDPLATEQFCLVLTADFSLILLLSESEAAVPCFIYSFEPDVVERVWQLLRLRAVMMRPQQVDQLDAWVAQFPPSAPTYQRVSQFNQLLLAHLPEPSEFSAGESRRCESELAAAVQQLTRTERGSTAGQRGDSPTAAPSTSLDVELLQAIAHEVRTPLTTIRTLTRLLLKRQDLAPDVLKRLEMIDRECSDQIDRFGFIFRAVELETSASQGMALTATSLAQIFEQSIPRWQQQARQRGLTLEVTLPQHIPPVVTDPVMLDQALSNLIDRYARSLAAGSRIHVEVTIAGHQLKLQVQCDAMASSPQRSHKPLIKSLGQLLMFQPETGNLSLNLAVTKNLFQAMGGKMTVRQRSEEDEVFTIFLPIESRESA
jgi:signal transduction histidine kinase